MNPAAESTGKFISALKEAYLADQEHIAKAIRSYGMFQAIDSEYFIKIDFYNRELVPGELDRSVIWEILPGVFSRLVSREDAILSKLIWIQKGSSRSMRDVVSMLRNPAPIDWAGMRERAERLGLSDLLDTLHRRAMTPPQPDEIDL